MLLLESDEYANHQPSGVDFPILMHWAPMSEREQAITPLLQRELGDVLTGGERQIAAEFMRHCTHSAFSGSRDPYRRENAMEVELFSVLTRIAQAVPLIARMMVEARWDDVMIVMADARQNLLLAETLQAIGRHVDDRVNPELSPEEVECRNFED